MATITGKALITKALQALQDADGTHWSREEMLDYLNDGQLEAVIICPEACISDDSFKLTPNTIKQTLPDGGLSLIDVTRNMGGDGAIFGRSIRIVSREILDAQYPEWPTARAGITEHFMYDPRVPKTFYVYPKAPVHDWYVGLVYADTPEDTDDASKPIGIDVIYANALLAYMQYRAYSKDADYAQNVQLAAAHYTVFNTIMSGKEAVDQLRNPNLTTTPFNPSVPGSAKV